LGTDYINAGLFGRFSSIFTLFNINTVDFICIYLYFTFDNPQWTDYLFCVAILEKNEILLHAKEAENYIPDAVLGGIRANRYFRLCRLQFNRHIKRIRVSPVIETIFKTIQDRA
jgi:hypothetical protein